MNRSKHIVRQCLGTVALVALSALGGCAMITEHLPWGPDAAPVEAAGAKDYNYIIGPGDSLTVFVWRNPELNTTVTVRPDGKFSTSLVEDLEAAGKTPTALAREIETKLSEYIRDPLVTVTVGTFIGEYAEQVRVVGEATRPMALPYRKNMTALDVMIEVGGLTEFAAGNRATLVRDASSGGEHYRVRLEDLIKDGDIEANVAMQPGDVLIIPEAWF